MPRRTVESHADIASPLVATKLPQAAYERLRAAARCNDRSLSGQLRAIVREWAERGSPPPVRSRRIVRELNQ
jgi:hypothetical protein